LIRTEVITKDKRKQFKRESVARLSQAHYVVEGANLVRNEYGKLFADFFSLSLISRIPRFSVIINIIIFFNVLVELMRKEKVMKW
jgi:cytochrome c oxidase subunit 3